MSASVDQKFENFTEETLEEKAPTDGAGKADPMVAATIPALSLIHISEPTRL